MRQLLGLALIAIPLAACGSGSSSPSTGTSAAADSKTNKALQFAQCMRSHGVPNFPDPVGGRLDLRVQRTPNSTTVNGVTVNSPAFQSAMQACHAYLPNGGQPPSGPAPAGAQQAALKFAQCMRAHGVPNFPDPKVSGGNGRVGIQLPAGAGVDPSSPAFQSAQKACQPLMQKLLSAGGGVRKGP